MPELTRRAHFERSDTWHVYYGDVQVGTISVQPGLPTHARQWRWDCGFYQASHRHSRSGYASTFEQARVGFEAAWKDYLPRCTEADLTEHRRQRAWTAWKYAMHDAGLPLPTQLASGRARCLCGAAIDIAVTDHHVYHAHMDSQHA
ncbi:hypothetical protein [Bradyrhizobium sp. AUGA SZCCT0042]|uniref:hypothetical protein n=1 Tax=Bradyrhizobium sp. AUGA SZCCT0042 TaxID=2807651 RepID=UPI001BADD434|nr:hypothetical protein [Bradyrhizobium sp. AUGA SZCCT0042]MBR1302173.1 hypothetical protein [Bradyrhizobium sp. AUGA SZCCT0042]